MPSNALRRWRIDRMVALSEYESQCWASIEQVPPRPALDDENLRGFVMLLSAHWQGFCRDLYSECVQALVRATPPTLRIAVQKQCEAFRQLESRNPTFETVCADFGRFGIDLSAVISADPANRPRLTHAALLNKWRNYAAHHNPIPPAGGGVFDMTAVCDWRTSAAELATEIDSVLYNHLVAMTGALPW